MSQDTAISLPRLRDLLGGNVARRLGKSVQRVCEPAEFRQTVVPQLKPRHTVVTRMKGEPDNPKGIPQGTPISAVLANLYMYDVDAQIESDIRELDGFYRRYSDDILLIVRPGCGAIAEQIVRDNLRVAMLQAHDDKTERHTIRFDGRLVCEQADGNWGSNGDSKLNYLGFSFDGERIAIRDATVASFIERLERHVRRARYAAFNNEERVIRKRQIYAKLSPLGWGSAYGDWCDIEGPPNSVPRMGFHRYLKLAAQRMNSDVVRKQGRQLENLLHRVVAQEQERLVKQYRS